MLPMRIQASQ